MQLAHRESGETSSDESSAGDSSSAVPPSAPVLRERLRHALEHAAHYLPAQAPLEVFVHHNTLHAFQHRPFYEAVEEAARRLGVSCYLPEEEYRAALRRGRITEQGVEAVLRDWPLVSRDPDAQAGSAQTPSAASSPAGSGDRLRAWAASPPKSPDGLPPLDELRRLIQLYGLQESTPAGLRFKLAETDAVERLRPDLPDALRERFLLAARGSLGDGAQGLSPAAIERRAVPDLWRTCLDLSKALEDRRARPSRRPEPRFPRDLLVAVLDEDPCELVHPVLIPLCAAFLDRGQAQWEMPDRALGFYAAWQRVLTSGYAVRAAWERRLEQRLRRTAGLDAEDVVLELLRELGITENGPDEIDAFIEHVLLQLPGWAGMFRRLEGSRVQIGLAADPPRVQLVDFLAVRLSLDVLAYLDVAGRIGFKGRLHELRPFLQRRPRLAPPAVHGPHDTAWPLFQLAQLVGLDAPRLRALHEGGGHALQAVLDLIDQLDEPARLRVWHEAFERHYRDEILAGLCANRAAPIEAPPARFQVVCCIDDRHESFRRLLEEHHPEVETFGAAGFFNVAIAFQGLDDPSTFPLCPVVVQPQHLIVEHPAEEHAHLFDRRLRRRRRWGRLEALFSRASRSLIWGPVLTALSGFVAAVPLLLNVFLPRFALRARGTLQRWLLPEVRTELTHSRSEARAAATAGMMTGFTVEEKAARVATLLENIGMVRDFAPMIAILGHDSSSVNNPHFAAYSCGACGGRSGGPNARLVARMANRREVRELLRERGILIPEQTLFVGGVHDTCADAITLYDEAVPPDRMGELDALRALLDDGRRRNAHERARRFASASPDLSPDEALVHVQVRGADLGQARPELGHATNASCVVGRRALTRGLFLDRRAFLVSYDPTVDLRPDAPGAILERTLLAVGPVGSGINLEYFFSTVDNERLGAGTKLPHNVTGLVGVMNGASSDLRTGLPKQMIEIHEPVRLQLILESRLDIVAGIVERQPAVAELVRNEWVRVATVDPDTGAIHTFDPQRGFVPWRGSAEVPTVPRSVEWYHGRREFVPPALIRPSGPAEKSDARDGGGR